MYDFCYYAFLMLSLRVSQGGLLLNSAGSSTQHSDTQIKKEICFGETLVVSCGHYEGDIQAESSDSEWSCHDTTETESSEEVKKETSAVELKDRVEEEAVEEEAGEEEDNFHFFFFPDCNKTFVQNSKASIIIDNGLPKVNPQSKSTIACTCAKDKKGTCGCFVKLPCKCGAKTTAECLCSKRDNICICDESKPQPMCICKGSNICLCNPDGTIRPRCTCDEIEKPCVCYPDKYPSPVCRCKSKPKFNIENINTIPEFAEEEEMKLSELGENDEIKIMKGQQEAEEPCECQKVEPELVSSCACDPNPNASVCITRESKSICSCDGLKECTCSTEDSMDCKCYPRKLCNCGDPENCKCFKKCKCTPPCLCDTKASEIECICLDKAKQLARGLVCTCSVHGLQEDPLILKRVRAGKHGYRWCHQVDPRHTFFDYGYDRHDKISYKVQEREKIKILGLLEKEEESETCPVHGTKAPHYKKKIRKPSIDCCSSVGGISITVETLGEDKDKFLVQVVCHASKEGAKTGSKLVSILDCKLHTMEENRTEYITKKELTKERRSYMTICENGYYNKVTRVCGERDIIKRFYHSFEDARNFLLEGANIVLMRYFGLSRYKGTIKTDCVLMDGTICESIYVCLGVSQAIVNGKPLCVVKVERHIIEPSGALHQSLTVLSLRGYTISHEWADNAYILHINPLLRVVPETDEIEQHAPLRERWREDLQLLSDYLDFKSKRTSEGARYMEESGVLTRTVHDYLQALLLLRPSDALHFTRHYFGSTLSALDLPRDEYFDPTTKHVRYHYYEQ